VIGYIVRVKLLTDIIPEIGHGPRLNVDIYRGALTEGLLTFTIALITLGITATKIRRSFFMKTWISSIMKLILHKLGSNLTGGCMNPASVSFQLTKFMIFNSSFFLVKRYSMLRFSKYTLMKQVVSHIKLKEKSWLRISFHSSILKYLIRDPTLK
jgi:hypothetical protein